MNCDKCKPRQDTAEEVERAEKERIKRGCHEPSTIPQFADEKTGEVFYRCPISIVTNESWEIIGLLNFIEAGLLPYSGGVLEQPAYLFSRLKCAMALKNEYIGEKEKKMSVNTNKKVKKW